MREVIIPAFAKYGAVGVLGICILVALAVFVAVNAAPQNLESESGTKSSGIFTQGGDTSASGNSLTMFTLADDTCTGGEYEAGGPDPWGGCWPGPDNTGVPDGVTLSAYTGSCTVTAAGTTIDSRTVNCTPLIVRAANVVITNSQLNGGVSIESGYCSTASFTITDSTVDIPDEVTGGNSGSTGLLRCNFRATRVEVTGGRRSMYCVTNCIIENSWVHEQGVDVTGTAHFSGIRMEQYATIRHNSITCEATRTEGSGCSAGLTGYGDFAPVQHNLVERNLFYRGGGGGSTICAYGGASGDDGSKPYGADSEYISFISNRFVRDGATYCGNVQTVLDFDPAKPGNVWIDNRYDDGAAVTSG